MQKAPQYDLVITGGRVIDPARGVDQVADVAVRGDVIADVGADLNTDQARVIDASGLLVTPGLIDLHTHVAGGLRRLAGEDVMLAADIAGVHAGVTTILDAVTTRWRPRRSSCPTRSSGAPRTW